MNGCSEKFLSMWDTHPVAAEFLPPPERGRVGVGVIVFFLVLKACVPKSCKFFIVWGEPKTHELLLGDAKAFFFKGIGAQRAPYIFPFLVPSSCSEKFLKYGIPTLWEQVLAPPGAAAPHFHVLRFLFSVKDQVKEKAA